MTTSITNNSHADIPIVPPQLPPVLASVFDLKPILGNPSRGEVKLVHEAANLRPKAPDLRDTDLLIELSQHLFDIQMACHQQKYPTSVLPNDAVYDPPTLPVYIPVELKPVSGPPSNDEIASVHTALRISESFANVPSTFDPDVHVQLSQHLFDIQLARHVQRSIMKRSAPAISMHMDQDVHEGPSETDGNNNPKAHTSPAAVPHQVVQSTESQNAPLEQPSSSHEATSHENPRKTHEHYGPTEFIVQIRDKLEDITRILVGTQNSLARGFNSSTIQGRDGYTGISHNLGAHSLINAHGEVPETHNLPTFTLTSSGLYGRVVFSIDKLTENILARYLRFYAIGEEMIEEGEELKIKSGMLDDAKRLLSGRLFLNR